MLKNILVDYNPIAKITNLIFNKFSALGDLADHVKGLLFNKDDSNLQKLLFLIGVSAITYKASSFLYKNYLSWNWVPSHIINHNKLSGAALKQKYGDCWVLITGFTQGIGRGYAQIFAQFGFNLLLMNRDEKNTMKKAEQLRSIYKNIKIEYIVCNMSDKTQISQIDSLIKKYNHLDIGIVINNAGSVAGGPYLSIKPELLIEDINVDVLAIFKILQIMVPKLRSREKRSAILNIASCTGVFLSPRVGVYSSTKRTVDIYTKILQKQNRDKIDIVSVTPFGVTTKMMKMKKGPFMITPRQCAYSSLADALAGQKSTFTHYKHKLSKVAFQHLTQDESFKLYDMLWQQAKQQAQN